MEVSDCFSVRRRRTIALVPLRPTLDMLCDPFMAGVRPSLLRGRPARPASIGDLGDQLLDDCLPKRVEIFGLKHKASWSAADIIAIVFRKSAGGICVLGIPRQWRLAQDHQPIDGNASRQRFVAGLTDIP